MLSDRIVQQPTTPVPILVCIFVCTQTLTQQLLARLAYVSFTRLRVC